MAGPGVSDFQTLTQLQSPERRQDAFRKLISDLSEHLRPEEVERIVFLRKLPKDRTSTALNTLRYLIEVGTFSHAKVEPLMDLLKSVNRHDLVSDLVEPFTEEYPDQVSQSLPPPGTIAQGEPLKERANTGPAELSTTTTNNIPQSSGVQETDEASEWGSIFDGLTMTIPSSLPATQNDTVTEDRTLPASEPRLNDNGGATAVTPPHRMYMPVKVHDGPNITQYSSTTSSMSELQRYMASNDSLPQSDNHRAAAGMRVTIPKQSSTTIPPTCTPPGTHTTIPPTCTPPGTHTFPRGGYRGRHLSYQGDASITPPTNRVWNRSLSSRTRRAVTPPATINQRTTSAIFGNGYESLGHGFTFFQPTAAAPHTPVGVPSPGLEQEEVFNYPHLPTSASQHENLKGGGIDSSSLPLSFRQRPGSKRWLLGKIRRHRRAASVMSWSVKRDKLNEAIYKHQREKYFKCPYDMELEDGGKHPPRLTLYLQPYGFEEDAGKNLTLSVELSASVKSNISSTARIVINIAASESFERRKLNEVTLECLANSRIVRAKSFLSHNDLKVLECDSIEFHASAKLYNPS